MKTIEYVPVGGVCTKSIRVTVEDGRIAEVVFTGGCHGNTQGVASLVRGMDAGEAVRRLEGHRLQGQGHFLSRSAGPCDRDARGKMTASCVQGALTCPSYACRAKRSAIRLRAFG